MTRYGHTAGLQLKAHFVCWKAAATAAAPSALFGSLSRRTNGRAIMTTRGMRISTDRFATLNPSHLKTSIASQRWNHASSFDEETPMLGLSFSLSPFHSQYHHHLKRSQRLLSTASVVVNTGSNIDDDVLSDPSSSKNTAADFPTSWMSMYNLLVEYHKEHNSTIVPDCCDNEVHLEIRNWIKIQRQQSRRLSTEQKNLLNQLGFVWDHQQAQWLEKYERLCDYESKMPVKMSTTEIGNISSSDLESVFEKRYQKDPILRRWVNAQRQKYRRDTISMERVRLLEKVDGFVWDVKEARWLEMHRRLSLFAEQHNGSCIVPQNYAADPQLACWVSNQRHRKNQLTSERIQMLDTLGFVWDVQELQWMGNYEKYKAMFFGDKETKDSYGSEESNTRTNKSTKGDDQENVSKEKQQLIDWAIKQRQNYRNGTLLADRQKLLDDLVHPLDGSKFVWDPQGQNWMEMYNELKEYRKVHEHVMVPTRSTRYDEIDGSAIDANNNDKNKNHDDDGDYSSTASPPSPNRQLGIWVANQRRTFKKGALSRERQKLLNDIGFVWDAPEAMWNEQYRRLLDYRKRHIGEGKDRSTSTLVPQHYPRDPQLAIWVKEQRQNRKHGTLTAERRGLLEKIGFVWDASPSP